MFSSGAFDCPEYLNSTSTSSPWTLRTHSSVSVRRRASRAAIEPRSCSGWRHGRTTIFSRFGKWVFLNLHLFWFTCVSSRIRTALDWWGKSVCLGNWTEPSLQVYMWPGCRDTGGFLHRPAVRRVGGFEMWGLWGFPCRNLPGAYHRQTVSLLLFLALFVKPQKIRCTLRSSVTWSQIKLRTSPGSLRSGDSEALRQTLPFS